MKICPKCLCEHNKKGTFCSRKCANSRVWSNETKIKRKESNIKFAINNPEKYKKTQESINKQKHTLFLINKEKFLNGKIIDRAILKKWLIIFKGEETCDRCGLSSEWNGKYLSLQVHHKKDKDNKPVNLELLCPNCHSQTNNYAGKGCISVNGST